MRSRFLYALDKPILWGRKGIIMKKLSVLVLSVLLVLGLAACGSSGDSGSSSSTGSSGSSSSSSSSGKVDLGKTLVVYFSATGNTERVAKYIASDADADIFEVTPSDPYTDDDLDWTNDDSRVSREHEDESLRDVKLSTTKVKNWDDYDTVFIGYPIWWGIAAWPMNTFVEANDFSGKTVIPFCTSSSSGLGDSATRLQKLAKGGDWQDGMRFSEGASEDEVSDWISEISK